MKWLKRCGAALLGLLILSGILAAIGLALPQNHSARSTTSLPVAADQVFTRVSDVAGAAAWRSSIDRVELLNAAGTRFREHGGDGPLTMEIVAAVGPSHFKTRIADQGLPFGGTWTWHIENTDDGSHVTVEENGEIYNPIFRVISRYAVGYNATVETYLGDLAASFGVSEPTIDSSWSR